MKLPYLAFGLAAFAATVHADEPSTGPGWRANVALTTDYRYRGISQTRLQPALQAGLDYTGAAGGWYAGTWLSSITWTRDAGGSGTIELDFYGGKRGTLIGGLGYDAGLLAYAYPSNGLARRSGWENANTAELYGQLGYGIGALKYSHALTPLFGLPGSRGSAYLELLLNMALSRDSTLSLHVGRQRVHGVPGASYGDWKAAYAHDAGPAVLTLAVIGTNARKSAYLSPADGRFLGRRSLQMTLGRTF